MVGGGHVPAPGEISLSHNGCLFLDELPEFNRRSLEVMRQPLEEGRVTISRAMASITFPANFMLIASMNPCPCGYMGSPQRPCKCTPMQVEKYLGRVSGPLLDRIDMHIEVPAVPYQELAANADGTTSVSMREQVSRVRDIQKQRFGTGARLNGRMSGRQLRKHCATDASGRALLQSAMEDLGLSARAHDRILRMARTIADLAGSADVKDDHISEAINYRTLDRKLWVK
jgi:magnesium chelatase family protein